MNRHFAAAIAGTAAALFAHSATAADVVTDAMAAAYAPYRSALFRTNTNSQAESAQAMAATRSAWSGVMQRFGSSVPAPYDHDPEFRATLSKVDAVLAKSENLVREGQLSKAHETLEEVRDLLGALRARNGVITFSDHMNEFHARMEEVLSRGPALLEQPGGMALLLEQTAVLGYLAGRLREAAPPTLSADAEFASMQQAITGSVARLRDALLRQEAGAAREALGGVKGPYSRMFLKFG